MPADLRGELAALASAVDWAEPDAGFVGRVRGELAPSRRRVALVAGAIGALVGVGLSPAGSALADLFAVDGLEVKEVDVLPAAPVEPDLGRPVTLAEARAATDVPVRVPTSLGPPDGVYLGTPPGGVTLRWRAPGVLLTHHPGDLSGVVKTVPEDAAARRVEVDGTVGLWLTGPHVVTYESPDGELLAEPPRRTGNTLVWSRDGVLTRIEVDGPLRDALAVARSLRP